MEYLGCPFSEGVVSYSIPQGMVRGSILELMDHTFDGKEDSRTGDLRGGIGQLVDGRYGYDNFKAGGKGLIKGYDWLGWKKRSNQASLSLVFAFDTVRTFQRVDIHANNHFTKDIQIFKQAKVYFSNEEDKFGDDRVVDFKYMPDLAIENARNVSINLKGQHGKYVMLQLYFAAKWILISEVTFYSEPRTEQPFTTPKENLFGGKVIGSNSTYVDTGEVQVEVAAAPIDIDIKTDSAQNDSVEEEDEEDKPRRTVGIVIGVLLTVISILMVGILWVVYRAKSSKEKRTTPTHSLLASKCPDRFSNSIDFKDHHLVNMQYTPYNNSSLTDNAISKQNSYEETIYEEPLNTNRSGANYLSTEDGTDEYAEPGGLLISNSLGENIYAQATNIPLTKKGVALPPLPLNHYARPLSPQSLNASAIQSLVLPPPPSNTASMLVSGTTSATSSLGAASSTTNHRSPPPELRSLLYRNTTTAAGLPPTPHSSSSSSNSPNNRFHTASGLEKRRPSKSSRTSTLKRKAALENSSTYYASNDVVSGIDLAKLYAQVNKSTADSGGVLAQPFKRSTSIDTVNVTLNEIDRRSLEVVRKLGEGQFGEICCCSWTGRFIADAGDQLPTDLPTKLVAVKQLRRNCDAITRSDFEHEARILTSLNDTNLVRVLGVCCDKEDEDENERSIPMCMVCEYTEEGDLCQFLQDHVAETTLSKSPNVPTLRY
jgi:discoidin domain receptor family protein 2